MRNVLVPLALLIVVACREPAAPHPDKAVWSDIPNAYASHFRIQVKGEQRRLQVIGPKGEVLGVYGRTTDLDDGITGLVLPLTRVAVVSTTHLFYFTALGKAEVVIGAAHTNRIREPMILDRVAKGQVTEIAKADGLDREILIALDPQALFDYPFGRDGEAARTGTVVVTEYLEEHPLGRAEWIRFFGQLLGEQERADSIFRSIEHRYRTMQEMTAAVNQRPLVFFGSHWDQTWFAPAGNSYMATLITDAGGHYYFADSVGEGNVAVPLERLLLAAQECEHLGVIAEVEGVPGTSAIASDQRLSHLDAVAKGGFISNSATSDIFGRALLEPDVVLKDLRCIFHPSTCERYEPVYFQPVK